ncbi:MAG TPA: DNA-binding response regulator [Thermoleophilaceae bacterium]|nr:DNA-binding response regulator [Thermoleophilaceae bacterium]
MTTVVAASFEDLVGIGLSVLIENDPQLQLLARDVPMSELDAVLTGHSPQVLLLNFAALSKPADVLVLHRRFPDTRIVLLADRPAASDCIQMLEFGATGCLSKETEGRDIIAAIHHASRGMHVLPRSAAAGGAGVGGPRATELTARESEVSELLQRGRTNAEISKRLSIGVETVRTHARSIYRKLGVPSRRELAHLAQQEAVVVDAERRLVTTI